MSKKELDVVAALIEQDGKFLLCQRKDEDHFGGLWEFPGGTVEQSETLTFAVEREIKEELDFNVKPSGGVLREFYDESDCLKIRVFLIRCSVESGVPKCKDCKDFGFFDLSETAELNLAPVDRKIFEFLKGGNK